MRFLSFLLLLSVQLVAQNFKKIHARAVVVDTHNDILMKAADQGLVFDTDLTGKASSDLVRWKKGGLDLQVFSVYCDGDTKNAFAMANRQMDSLDAVAARNPHKIERVANTSAALIAIKKQKIAAMFGVEGGHMIETDLAKLEAIYQRGARYLTLTHNVSPEWATSAKDETTNPNLPHKGLTDFGRKVVAKMNQLGMLIDLSHAGDQTFWDVLNMTSKPVIASHSSVYALVPHRRNLKDSQIKAIAKNQGVVQINFNPGFIDVTYDDKETAFLAKHQTEIDSLTKSGMSEFYVTDHIFNTYASEAAAIRPPLSLVIDHIDYVAKLVGVDYVGLGSDFDGINQNPKQLDDVTTYPLITKALLERGYATKDIRKILGGNFIRVLRANEH